MKTLEKAEMLERNKVMRVLTEARILSAVDHPFLASLYGTITTDTHLHFLMQICEGGELYALLTSQPSKRFKESHVRFYTAEVSLRTSFPEGSLQVVIDDPCAQTPRQLGLIVYQVYVYGAQQRIKSAVCPCKECLICTAGFLVLGISDLLGQAKGDHRPVTSFVACSCDAMIPAILYSSCGSL